jgi:PhzF family phenazine biosynthesis protein
MEVLRYTAFSSDPEGGNPAGVVLDATGETDAEMQTTAAAIGYSETAFLVPQGERTFDVRYFSPLVEVPFCGHATIAAAVAYAQRFAAGRLVFDTSVGKVPVDTMVREGQITATLTSVEPSTAPLPDGDLDELLAALRWDRVELDPTFPPRIAFAGAWHPILVVRTRQRLAALAYDFHRLAALMAARNWTTINLIFRASADLFYARNPFPPGGVVEDPATGAAAAALGGYLRELGLLTPPATITVRQGDDLGRPGVLIVDIPRRGGIRVTGTAVPMS